MTTTNPGFYAMLYRWRLKPGREQAFATAWAEVTEALLGEGSLGSRLHHGSDGNWYGYAQWPDADVRATAFAKDLVPGASARMQAAIAETLPAVELTPVADFLRLGALVPKGKASGEP